MLCVVCNIRVLFETARVRSKYKDGCDGQQTFLLKKQQQPNVKYVNDPQSTYQKKSRKHFKIMIDQHASVMWSTLFKTVSKSHVCQRG